MANQYEGSFEHTVQRKFNTSARDALLKCQRNNLSYDEAGKELGFQHGTIRKWAKRYKISLRAGEPPRLRKDQFLKLFRQPEMNKYNVLSRNWIHANIFATIPTCNVYG